MKITNILVPDVYMDGSRRMDPEWGRTVASSYSKPEIDQKLGAVTGVAGGGPPLTLIRRALMCLAPTLFLF